MGRPVCGLKLWKLPDNNTWTFMDIPSTFILPLASDFDSSLLYKSCWELILSKKSFFLLRFTRYKVLPLTCHLKIVSDPQPISFNFVPLEILECCNFREDLETYSTHSTFLTLIFTETFRTASAPFQEEERKNVDEAGFKMDDQVLFLLLKADVDLRHIQTGHDVRRGWRSNGDRANLHVETNWI